jgi:penicillin amidase
VASLSDQQRVLAQSALADDRTIGEIAATHGVGAGAIRDLARAYLAEKADLGPAEVKTAVKHGAEILRDHRGVPHIAADNVHDLYFALGYAQAQDRLWQLDYLRRQARGTLSDVYGRATLDSDILSRTLNISELADQITARLSTQTREALGAFAEGVNAWLAALPNGLPVEFEVNGYAPEPWRIEDSIAIQRRWWWYLTGRLGVILTPEAVRAGLGDGARFDAFFAPDAPVAYIVHEGEYDPTPAWPDLPIGPLGESLGGADDGTGSNNWATAPKLNKNGASLLGSDPHVYFTAPAEWYEFHLHGAGYDASWCSYPGMGGLLYGRNQHLAWGLTNNISSLRDLYVETVKPDDPNQYRNDGIWTRFETRVDEIAVKGEAAHRHETRYAHGRPVVDHLMPAGSGAGDLFNDPKYSNAVLSMRWVGLEFSDEIKCMIDLAHAGTVQEGREALRNWRVPTFSFMLADDSGSIAYQCTGGIPIRGRQHRGYRFPDNPDDAWIGTVPFDGLPHVINPERGWIESSNNPTAPADYPYPLAGTWAPEDRAARGEKLLQERAPHTLETFREMQFDIFSGRAERGLKGLLPAIDGSNDPLVAAAADLLGKWDRVLTTEHPGGAIFYAFFWRWHQNVIRARFSDALHALVQDAGWGLSSDLLHANVADWFASDAARLDAIRASFKEAVDWLAAKFGPDPSAWAWGKLHRLGAVHPAARTPLLHELFDLPYLPHIGGAATLASAFYTPAGTFDTKVGASYRLLASLGPDREMRALCWPGQSGHPGSPHYADQVAPFHAKEHQSAPFAWADVEANVQSMLQFHPAK